jgi:hypothetical protein
MAIVDVSSTELANIEADPPVMNDVRHIHGRLRWKAAFVTVADGDTNASIFRFFRVRSGDSIKSLQVRTSQAFTSGTGWDCGLYTINGGAEVDADLYCDGATLAVAAPTVPHVIAVSPCTEMRFGDATTSILSDINNAVFEDLGLSADPQLEYDVIMQGVAIGTQGGILQLTMLYTAGD